MARFVVNGLLVVALLGALAVAVVGWNELPTAAIWGRSLIVAALIASVVICVLFFVPFEVRANFTLAGYVSILALWAASWLLYEPQQSAGERVLSQLETAAREAGVSIDSRTPLEVIEDLRADGVDAYPPLSAWSFFPDGMIAGTTMRGARPETLPVLPLAGVSHATTVLCNDNEEGEYLILPTDRFGFNNPDTVYEASSSTLLIGDSFTFGYCVPPAQSLAGHLRSRGIDVVSIGYPGTGPLIQLAQLREYAGLVRPNVILWVYFEGNDLRNLSQEYREPALREYLTADYRQGLAARQAEIDAFWAQHLDLPLVRALANDRARPRLSDILLLQPLRARLGGRELTPDAPNVSVDSLFKYFEATLDGIVDEADRLDATLYFVYLPVHHAVIGEPTPRRERVLSSVRARGIPIIDFQKRLSETPDPLEYFPFRTDFHFTGAGYRLLAEQILETVPLVDSDANRLVPD